MKLLVSFTGAHPFIRSLLDLPIEQSQPVRPPTFWDTARVSEELEGPCSDSECPDCYDGPRKPRNKSRKSKRKSKKSKKSRESKESTKSKKSKEFKGSKEARKQSKKKSKKRNKRSKSRKPAEELRRAGEEHGQESARQGEKEVVQQNVDKWRSERQSGGEALHQRASIEVIRRTEQTRAERKIIANAERQPQRAAEDKLERHPQRAADKPERRSQESRPKLQQHLDADRTKARRRETQRMIASAEQRLQYLLDTEPHADIRTALSDITTEKSVRSAVIVMPPEALWGPIQAIRKDHHRAYPRWMPHINMMYPFVPDRYLPNVVPLLQTAMSDISSFPLTLGHFDHFDLPKYAAVFCGPDQDALASLERIHARLTSLFPFATDLHDRGFHPHLTVGEFKNAEVMEVKENLQRDWNPISFVVDRLYVIAREGNDPFVVKHEVKLQH